MRAEVLARLPLVMVDSAQRLNTALVAAPHLAAVAQVVVRRHQVPVSALPTVILFEDALTDLDRFGKTPAGNI